MIDDELTTAHAPLQRRSAWLPRALVALGLAALIAAALVWLAWRVGVPVPHLPPYHPAPVAGASTTAPAAAALPIPGSLDARLTALEARMDRADQQATASAGNSSRAEALLVAFAVRRAVDRGAQLGYLEDQLRLRFGDALPNSVALVTAAAHVPVTADQLSTRLEALAPALISAPASDSGWDRVRRDLANLFVLRRAPSLSGAAVTDGEQRLEHARVSLREGRIGAAISEVGALPGAHDPRGAAQGWISDARHYDQVQRALDLMETTALLEPRELEDGAGRKLGQSQGGSAPPSGAPGGGV